MILKGNGFILRHISMSDAKRYFEIQQDKDTRRGFMTVPESMKEARKELKMKTADFKKKKPFGESFAIEVKGEFAGFVDLCHLNKKHHEHEGSVSYCIRKEFRGKGITTAAVKLIVKYGFNKYKLKRMEARCRTFNKASAKVLKKAGFKLEGILRKTELKDGRYYDDMVWAIVR